jgi:hypothetical protein
MKRLVILLPVLLAFQVGVQPALAWTWPVDGPVLRPFVLGDNPYAAGQHRGIDIGAPTGTTVRAPAAGTVSFAGTVPTGGRTLTIRTSDGYSVTLLHLGTIRAVRGAAVSEGDPVGTVGRSGVPELAEPYVYLGIRVTADANGYVDPLRFLPAASAPAPAPTPAPAPAPVEQPSAAGAPTSPGAAPEPAQPVTDPGPDPVSEPLVASAPLGSARQRRLAPRSRIHLPADVPVKGVVSTQPMRASRANAPADSESLTGRSFGHEAPAARPGSTKVVATQGAGHGWRWVLLPALAAAALAAGLRLRGQLADARATDGASAVFLERVPAPTEDTGRLRLGEQNGLVFDRDLERILLAQAEALPDLDRDHDSSELVDVPDDPRARHSPPCAGRRPDRRLSSHGLRAGVRLSDSRMRVPVP